jgi:hypothetical protein
MGEKNSGSLSAIVIAPALVGSASALSPGGKVHSPSTMTATPNLWDSQRATAAAELTPVDSDDGRSAR